MAILKEEKTWNLINKRSSKLIGNVANSILARGWKAVSRKLPPQQHGLVRYTWKEILLWSVMAGVTAGVIEYISRKSADTALDIADGTSNTLI